MSKKTIMSTNHKRYINEIVLCPTCNGEAKVRKTEKELHFSRYDDSLYKTCPDCLGKGRLRKVGEWKYERV
jgi:DnaJ-class molecular chaperone